MGEEQDVRKDDDARRCDAMQNEIVDAAARADGSKNRGTEGLGVQNVETT
jgi:hypothetical protein